MNRLRRPPAGDSGASLILALAFMTFLGLVVASLLAYVGTSLRTTEATQARAEATYDVDGAMQAAVNAVRTASPTLFTNAVGETCPQLDFPGPNTSVAIPVTCLGGRGTGAAGGLVAINANNRPANALLTLGGGADTGIDKDANNILRVHGNVYVNNAPASIKQAGTACPAVPQPPAAGDTCSELLVDGGTVTAKGTCEGTVAASATNCSEATPDPAGDDPAYTQPAGPLTYQPVPPCGAAHTVSFQPGYYDDAVALSALTNGSCGKVLHFLPGTYFFDFHNGDKPLPDGQHVWTINDPRVDVVGGTPQGWTPAHGKPIIPGACVSPLDSATNGGVEFVFGGDSRVDVQAGDVELCGQYSLSSPPTALFGATTGADAAPLPVTGKSDGTGVSSGTGPAFSSPENITEAGEGLDSEAALDGAAGDVTSEVTLNGFVPDAVPAGSILTKAELFVWHRDQSTTGSTPKDLHVEITPQGDEEPAFTGPVTRHVDGPDDGPFSKESIDVTSDALRAAVHDRGLTGLQVKYSATAAAGENITERLDSLQLELTWAPPAVRAQNAAPNCLVTGGCAMIKAAGLKTRLYVQGTTYAPLATMDVHLTNVSAEVFAVGIIVRALTVHLSPSAGNTGSLIAVPDIAPAGPPKPLEVYFRAYVCPSGQACDPEDLSAPWRLVGTARVKYEDLIPPASGYDQVTVLGWTVREIGSVEGSQPG